MFTFWVLGFLAEIMLYFIPFVWKLRRGFATLIGLIIIVSTIGILGRVDAGVWLLISLVGLYRMVNMLRIIKARMNEYYLRQVARRTSLWLFLIQTLLLVGVALPYSFITDSYWQLLAILQTVIAATLTAVTIKNIVHLRFRMPDVFLTDRELPTVSVAIPARNETADLQLCLQSILANDYPKLEVLVLDDCSQSGTADIIRSFAHEGVRFIPGQEPAERWLAKNQAYQKLYQEATGDVMLFCGADAQFGPQAIRSLINLMATRQKSMISVLPIRRFSSVASAFIQPMRYWWELSFPRRLFNKPAVLSTCWMIDRRELRHLGGFGAVSHAILPERFFAREMAKTDRYSFVSSSAELDVETVKNISDQYATAIRNRYPQLRRRPEWVLSLTVLHSLFLLLPFVMLLLSPWWHPVNIWLPILSSVFLIVCHVTIVNNTDPSNSLLASITFPVVVVIELYILYSSMLRYEFFSMNWKDRNICIPVMHVIPKLPRIK